MARIAFFTERLPPDSDPITNFSYELMCTLADQQHDLRVLSTYDDHPLPPTRARIEVLRPFRSWGWLEIPRLLPTLFDFDPDVLHIIQPRAQALRGFTNAMNAIPGLAPVLRRPLVTSFYDLREESLRAYRPLLAASQAITVINQAQADLVKGFLITRSTPYTLKIVSAPGLFADTGESSEMDVSLQAFLAKHIKFVYLPGNVSDHREPASVFDALAAVLREFTGTALVIGGGWGPIPPRARHDLMRSLEASGAQFLVTGPLSRESERHCFEKARVVFTASLPASSLQLTRILREALQLSAPLIMSREQAELDPLPWQDRLHSVITGPSPHEWQRALTEALSGDDLVRGIRSRLAEFARLEAVDQPGNIMSRIYSELLAGRR